MIITLILTTSLIHFSLKSWVNVRFELVLQVKSAATWACSWAAVFSRSVSLLISSSVLSSQSAEAMFSLFDTTQQKRIQRLRYALLAYSINKDYLLVVGKKMLR